MAQLYTNQLDDNDNISNSDKLMKLKSERKARNYTKDALELTKNLAREKRVTIRRMHLN